MEKYLFFLIPLVAGWLLDKAFGDPAWLPHPVVGFGKLITWGERHLNQGDHRLLKGGIMAIMLIAGAFILTLGILVACSRLNDWLGVAIASILVFYCLAGTTLVREVREVFRACDRSLDEGRQQVSRIVGRDTSQLSAQEVRTAALETLAENLSDGVVAPLFWYALLGVPGMVAYKMVNTLDSMIGYRNERFFLFGRVAARIDDVANFIPARLTAVLMVALSGKCKLFTFVRKYGHQHLSPNSGFPEAALAGILDCRFGGPHNYFGELVEKPFIGTNPRELTMKDMLCSIRIVRWTEAAFIAIVAILYLFIISLHP